LNIAPVVLFVYNRPLHTKKVLNALSLNALAKETNLFIFCDGPKSNANSTHITSINNVIKIIKNENRFKSVNITIRNENLGLSKSIINGVSEIISIYGNIIVLEDDIVPEIGFLNYMNTALNIYKDNSNVGCIHAWNYSINTKNFTDSTFFLLGGDCWGWATWERSWNLFNNDGTFLFNQIREHNLEYIFERRGTHNFLKMLDDQIKGYNDSWAIRWHASLVLNNKYCLFPIMPIVRNIGLDNSGVHCETEIIEQNVNKSVLIDQIQVTESEIFFKEYKKYLIYKKISIKYISLYINKIYKKIINNFTSLFLKF
jgi:hypothetical protein